MTDHSPEACYRQQMVFKWVEAYWERFKCSPSAYEVARAQGISPEFARRTLKRLVEKCQLFRVPGSRRGWRLPTDQERCIVTLREIGWTLCEDGALQPPLANMILTEMRALYQIPGRGDRAPD